MHLARLSRILIFTVVIAPSLLAAVPTQPLYQYRSSQGNHLLATSASLPAGISGQWVNQGVIAHVPRPSGGTRPVYSLFKSDELGTRYAYSIDPNEGGQGGWQRQEAPAFHVLTKQLPGSLVFYRLYLPLRQKSWGPEAGTDTHAYTTDLLRLARATGDGWVNEGALGFVWETPPLDLSGQKTPKFKPLDSSSGDDRKKIKIKPQGARVPSPSIKLTGTQLQSDGRTSYSIAVTNASSYDPKSFVTTTGVLPKAACGDTRMIATVMVSQGGARRKVDCYALTSQGALQNLDFRLALPLADDDSITLILHDRLVDEYYTSEPYSAGWTNIGPLLGTVGCKSFLGRAGSYLCTEPKGFQACENLRKAGKPIQCRQAGTK